MHWLTPKKILAHGEPPGCRQQRPRTKRKLGAANRCIPHSFNGAALGRARRAQARQNPLSSRFMLQRGRARESAESAQKIVDELFRKCASTGPRSGERGEWSLYCTKAGKGACFNGAALGRARRVAQARAVFTVLANASTGPRSGERGESPSSSGWAAPRCWLQRGRARESAERTRQNRRARPRSRVASTGPRSGERGETQAAGNVATLFNRASTGPRSGERGERPRLRSAADLPDASTGPRSGERGEPGRAGRTAPQTRRFNGAALGRARRGWRCPMCRARRTCFNGAALGRARRGRSSSSIPGW